MEGLLMNLVTSLEISFFPMVFLSLGTCCSGCNDFFIKSYRSNSELTNRKKPETEKEKLEKFLQFAEKMENLLRDFQTVENYEKIREVQYFLDNAFSEIGKPRFMQIAGPLKNLLENRYRDIRTDVSAKNAKRIIGKIESNSNNAKFYSNIERMIIFKNETISRLYMTRTDLMMVRSVWEEKILKKFRESTKSSYEDLFFKAKLLKDKYKIREFQDLITSLVSIFATTHEEGNSLRDALNENYKKLSLIETWNLPFYEAQLKKAQNKIKTLQTEELSGIDKINQEITRLKKTEEYYLKLISALQTEKERIEKEN